MDAERAPLTEERSDGPHPQSRIQTRLFLFLIVGFPITLLYGLSWSGWLWDWRAIQIFVWFLRTIIALGLVLDPLYILPQTTRWDHD